MAKVKKNRTLAIGARTASGRSRRLPRIILAILVLLLAALAGFLVMQYLGSDTHQTKIVQQHFSDESISIAPVTPQQRNSYKVAPDRPRYISIPTLGINQARVMALGVKTPNKNGQQQLDVPKNINDVGWYDCQINPVANKRCSRPTLPGGGDTNTAMIMAGHTCFSRTMRCVFDKISNLKSGDQIIIERGDGQKINFAVRRVDVLKLADVDMSKAIQPIEAGKEGLTLITCAGTYRGTKDANGVPTADKRVLVYAVLE